MEAKDKIEIFRSRALQEAEERRKASEANIEAEFKRLCAEISAKAEKESGETVKKERNRLEQEVNKALSEIKVKTKKERAQYMAQLEEKIFNNVEKKINDFRKTKDYETYLITGINKVISEFGTNITVCLCPSDMSLKKTIEEITKVSVKEAAHDFTGGFTAIISDGKISLDNTLGTRIDEARSDFRGVL